MIVLELFLFCLLFTAVVKIFVPHNAIEGLFFCPASVQERVIAMGKANRAQIERRRKAFKLTICGFPRSYDWRMERRAGF